MSKTRQARRARARNARKRLNRGKVRERASVALHALASSALALPGLATSAFADAPAERAEADYRFTYYKEDDTPAHRISGGTGPGGTGDSERYEIQAHQFHYGTPWGERMDLDFSLVYETMTGASPIRVVNAGGPTGNQVVMSGATIEEERVDFTVGSNYYFDSGRAGASLGYSDENDYSSFYFGFDGEKHVNDKSTTLLGGVALAFDEIDSTSNGNPHVKDDKQSYSVFGGVAQVLSRTAVLQATATYKLSTGYLSDPYKQALVGAIPLPDLRPDTRHQVALLLRSRKHFEPVNGTLRGDLTYSFDDWGLHAGAVEVAWHQSLLEMFELVPHFRYYSQGQADFYNTTFGGLGTPSHYSSDYRLSPYGAISYGFKAEFDFRGMFKTDWQIAASYERYHADADLALQSVSVENPGLIANYLASVRLTGRF